MLSYRLPGPDRSHVNGCGKQMRQATARYTILHLLLLTVIVAFYYVALLTESPWWRATLMTISLCLFLQSIIASIITRGERQAFALGYMASTLFFLVSLYASFGIETLPYLLTQMLWTKIATVSTSPPSEEHFYIVAALFWSQTCSYTGGALSRRWHRQRSAVAGET